MNNWKIILATVVIFGAGIVAGTLLVSHVNGDKAKRPQPVAVSGNSTNPPTVGASVRRDLPPNMEQRRIDFMRNVSSNLNLSLEQRAHVDAVLSEGQERIKTIWEPCAAQMREEMTDIREKIHAELTLEQTKRFEELMKRPVRKPEDPTKIADDLNDQLLNAKLERIKLSTELTPQHPNLILNGEKIARLEKQAPPLDSAKYHEKVQQKLKKLEDDKLNLERDYLPAHPKVIANQLQIKFLQDELLK